MTEYVTVRRISFSVEFGSSERMCSVEKRGLRSISYQRAGGLVDRLVCSVVGRCFSVWLDHWLLGLLVGELAGWLLGGEGGCQTTTPSRIKSQVM